MTVKINSSTERCPAPSTTVILEEQLRAARQLQNRLREALAPFANRTAEIDQNSGPLSLITDHQWREALDAYFATE